MASQPAQLLQRAVLRKQPAPPLAAAETAAPPAGELPADRKSTQQPQAQAADPHCLLDAASWSMCPAGVAEQLSASNADFAVVGVLGGQGLGKSTLLNRLLGLDCGGVPAAAPQPTPAFPVSHAAAAGAGGLPALQHCTRGIQLRVSPDRIIGLDTQPLFSASVLEEVSTAWEQPPPALAAPAVAAANDAKALAVPFEGAQALAQLQLAVLLLAACHRVVVLCDGLEDRATWELVLTAEMLARGVPDPSLPPRDASAAAAGPAGSGHQQQGGAAAPGTAAAAQQQAARARQGVSHGAEHLAEVVLVHVLRPGDAGSSSNGGGTAPTAAQLELLEARLASLFASSRLCRPRPLRMHDHVQGLRRRNSSDPVGSSSSSSNSSDVGMSYWVLPAHSSCSSGAAGQLLGLLLGRPCPPFARRCSELGWLRGVAGDVWRAVRKSPDIAAFYSRLARTQLKGAAGWVLAR